MRRATWQRRLVGARPLRLGRWPAVLAGAYAALGLCASGNDKYEIFPFFSWFLFPITPNQVTRYELATSATKTRLAQALSMDLEVIVQSLGKAVAAQEAGRIVELRERLESNFLKSPCSYAVTRRTYDPLAAWLGTDTGVSQVIAEFSCLDNP